jgi:diguanylate cyclase (GGDEF)-like protein
MDYSKIKNQVIAKIMIIVSVFVAIILVSQYKIEQNAIDDIINIERQKLQKVYSFVTDQFYDKYRKAGEKLRANERFSKAVKEQDRKTLIEITKPIYDDLKKDNIYFHNMHIHTKDSKSILRVHMLDKFGDDLAKSRPMILNVNKTKQVLEAVEVGKHAISSRVAMPIFHKGEHVGSLEFGIKIDYFTNVFKNKFYTDSFFVFHNKYLEPLFKNSKNFKHDTFKDISIVNNEFVDTKKLNFDLLDKVLHHNYLLEISGDNKYLAEIDTIKDFNGKMIGHIVFLIDMNKFMSSVDNYRITILFSFISLLVILFFILKKRIGFFVKKVNQHQAILEELSVTDELTRINNRRKMLSLFELEIQRGQRYKDISSSIIIFDIDHFKLVNDTYGHNVGDYILKELASLVSGHIRKTDWFGRWGGEEFIILATHSNIEVTTELANKLRKVISEYKFDNVGKVTCSFGVSKLDFNVGCKDSISEADKALYEAKESGRDKVVAH